MMPPLPTIERRKVGTKKGRALLVDLCVTKGLPTIKDVSNGTLIEVAIEGEFGGLSKLRNLTQDLFGNSSMMVELSEYRTNDDGESIHTMSELDVIALLKKAKRKDCEPTESPSGSPPKLLELGEPTARRQLRLYTKLARLC